MSKYTEKKSNYRPKEEVAKGRFGFEYNEEKINYRTEIPAIPEKLKQKPDDKIKEKRIQDINDKIKKIKDLRR